MLAIGIVLIVLALLVPVLHVLFWIGVVLAVIGLVLLLLSFSGREVGGRRWY